MKNILLHIPYFRARKLRVLRTIACPAMAPQPEFVCGLYPAHDRLYFVADYRHVNPAAKYGRAAEKLGLRSRMEPLEHGYWRLTVF